MLQMALRDVSRDEMNTLGRTKSLSFESLAVFRMLAFGIVHTGVTYTTKKSTRTAL